MIRRLLWFYICSLPKEKQEVALRQYIKVYFWYAAQINTLLDLTINKLPPHHILNKIYDHYVYGTLHFRDNLKETK